MKIDLGVLPKAGVFAEESENEGFCREKGEKGVKRGEKGRK
jgi:hypothetical protein